MKFFALLLSIIITSSLLASGEMRKSPITFRIDSIKPNQDLDPDETLYSFHFLNADYDANRIIQYAIDDEEFQTSLDPDNFLNIRISKGKHKFIFYFSPNFYEVYTDSIDGKEKHTTHVSIFLQTAQFEINVDKPVLYFYPEVQTEIKVKVHPTSPFTFTYPEYKGEWEFSAEPNGNLLIDNKELNYLFWESKQTINLKEFDLSYGTLVAKENVIAFLEESLDEIGFNSQEKEDFITYWGPQMIRHDNSFVQFRINEECDNFAKLEVSPSPEKLYRYYILIIPIDNGLVFDIAPQKLKKMDRNNFTVLEWGGFIVEDKSVKPYQENP